MLPTQKLYQTVDRTQYDEQKQRYIRALWPTYHGLDNRAKWAHLMEAFSRLFPAEGPVVLDFLQARLNTIESSNTISLANCLNYFEQFYFIYTTTDALYKLNDAEKRALKQQVLDGMGVGCETGKQERFELALASYRRDTHWIDGHLSQMRYHCLERLAEQYNQVHLIADSYSIHTNKTMKALAEAKQMGIQSEAELNDAYLTPDKIAAITAYFNTHSPAAYREFEAHAAGDLAQQLLNEFTDFLKAHAMSMTDWEQNGLLIPDALLPELSRFFDSKSFDAIMDDLRDESDETHLKFKKKADFIDGLQTLVKKKLLQNGYYVSLSALHALPVDADVPSLPTWHVGVSMQDVMAVRKALDCVSEDWADVLLQHQTVLLQYPQLVLSRVSAQIRILSVLPDALRINGLFVDAAITAVNTRLLVAMNARDADQIDRIIDSLFVFLNGSCDDLSLFSDSVLSHPLVAKALVKRNGVLLKQMPLSIRKNQGVVQDAIEQNGFALCFASNDLQKNASLIEKGLAQLERSYGTFGALESLEPLTPYQLRITQIYNRLKKNRPDGLVLPEFNRSGESAWGHPDLILERLKAIQQMAALDALCRLDVVGPLKLALLAQHITPEDLIRAVHYRKRNRQSSLPYCEQLESFHGALVVHHCHWRQPGGYWAARLRAQAVPGVDTDLHAATPVGFLARTPDWYMALVQHHRAHSLEFKTSAQWIQSIQKIIQAALTSMWFFLKCGALILALVSLILCLSLFIVLTLYSFLFLIVSAEVALFGAAFVASSAFFGVLNNLLAILGIPLGSGLIDLMVLHMLEPLVPIYALDIACTQLTQSTQALATHVYAFMMSTYATIFLPAPAPLPTDTLAARCERSIERLIFTKEEASAHQKGMLLSTLWDKIQAEGPCESEDVLKGRLNKKYDLGFQGKMRSLSFVEVASIKRQQTHRFKLDEPQPKSVFGFFAPVRATTTDSMLDCDRLMMPQAA